jgi:DNA-binding CsgD family transcriptional regulator
MTIAGKDTPILETGMANLTKNETRVLVHFADGQTQQWLMVRLENPQAVAQK